MTRSARKSSWWDALVTPSPPATGLMITVAGAIWALLWFGVGPRQVAHFAPYLAEDPRDSYAFMTGRLARIDDVIVPTVPTVIVVGASGIRYGIGDFGALQDELDELVTGARVIDLTTDDQSVLETLSILALVPNRFDGIVVIGTNPHRFSRPTALPDPQNGFVYRLGVRSPYLDRWLDETDEPPRPTRSYFWDNRRFLLPRLGPLIANAVAGAPIEFVPPHENPRKVTTARWDSFARTQKTIAKRFAAEGQGNLERIADAGQRFVERTSAALALLESPLAPRAASECYGATFMAKYDQQLTRFAQQRDWPYWKLGGAAQLAEPDFFDWMHLRNEGARARFRAQLAVRLAGHFQGT